MRAARQAMIAALAAGTGFPAEAAAARLNARAFPAAPSPQAVSAAAPFAAALAALAPLAPAAAPSVVGLEPPASPGAAPAGAPAPARVEARMIELAAALGGGPSIPRKWAELAQQDYRKDLASVYHVPFDSLEENAARRYGRRWEQGEQHARVLVELGHAVDRDADGKVVLVPPSDLGSLWSRYARRMRALVRAGAVAEEDVIHPALILVRRRGRAVEHRFIRPGIDAWPSRGGWRLEREDTLLPIRVFYRALAEGRMPTGIWRMIQHDLGHITEFYANPAIMARARRFARAVASGRVRLGSAHSPSALREAILAEFLSIPDIRRSALIRSLVPNLDRVAAEGIAAAERALRRLSPRALERHVGRLVEAAPLVLLRNGGAFRDFYNVERQAPVWYIRQRIAFALEGRRNGKPNQNVAAAISSLQSLAREIETLRDLRFRQRAEDFPGDSVQHEHARWLLARPKPVLTRELISRAARYEHALAKAVQLGITPELVHLEAGLGAPDRNSLTYAYFEAVSVPGDAHHRAFVAPARRRSKPGRSAL